jgi:hypothetical protein
MISVVRKLLGNSIIRKKPFYAYYSRFQSFYKKKHSSYTQATESPMLCAIILIYHAWYIRVAMIEKVNCYSLYGCASLCDLRKLAPMRLLRDLFWMSVGPQDNRPAFVLRCIVIGILYSVVAWKQWLIF